MNANGYNERTYNVYRINEAFHVSCVFRFDVVKPIFVRYLSAVYFKRRNHIELRAALWKNSIIEEFTLFTLNISSNQ